VSGTHLPISQQSIIHKLVICQAAKDCLRTSKGSRGLTSTPAELAEGPADGILRKRVECEKLRQISSAGRVQYLVTNWCVLQVYNTAQELADHLGKQTCISQDRPGFIVNRILMPMINEAFYTLMEVSVCRRSIPQAECSMRYNPMPLVVSVLSLYPMDVTLISVSLWMCRRRSTTQLRQSLLNGRERGGIICIRIYLCVICRVWAQQRALTEG